MIKEVSLLLKEKLSNEIKGISVYKGRKDKITVGGVSFNTIDQFLKKENYRLHNRTIIKLTSFFKIEIDEEYYSQNDIILLQNGKAKEQIQQQKERIQGY
jgi:hypothetical protein